MLAWRKARGDQICRIHQGSMACLDDTRFQPVPCQFLGRFPPLTPPPSSAYSTGSTPRAQLETSQAARRPLSTPNKNFESNQCTSQSFGGQKERYPAITPIRPEIGKDRSGAPRDPLWTPRDPRTLPKDPRELPKNLQGPITAFINHLRHSLPIYGIH